MESPVSCFSFLVDIDNIYLMLERRLKIYRPTGRFSTLIAGLGRAGFGGFWSHCLGMGFPQARVDTSIGFAFYHVHSLCID